MSQQNIARLTNPVLAPTRSEPVPVPERAREPRQVVRSRVPKREDLSARLPAVAAQEPAVRPRYALAVLGWLPVAVSGAGAVVGLALSDPLAVAVAAAGVLAGVPVAVRSITNNTERN